MLRILNSEPKKPNVTGFFHDQTNTISYVVTDPASSHCAVIDSVLDYDSAAGRIGTHSADQLIAYVEDHGLKCQWIIDTHLHADHLTAAQYLKDRLGGTTAIGDHIDESQQHFGAVFNHPTPNPNAPIEHVFDHLFADGECYTIGTLIAQAVHTPGHTHACMSHIIGDAVFVGDTLFMPDFGSARCDFPGGDASQLYDSIQKLYTLPDETRVFLCHDYKSPGRDDFVWETTIGAQKAHNIHLNADQTKEAFVALRTERDANLNMPNLIIPSVQVNMQAGHLPKPEDNGTQYLKVPLNTF